MYSDSGAIVMWAMNQGSYSGGSIYNPVRLPLIPLNMPPQTGGNYQGTYQPNTSSNSYNSNPGLFTPTDDGITVRQAGTYLVSGQVKVDEKNQGNTYAIGVNGRVDPNLHTTFATNGSGWQITDITTQLKLNAGDQISLNLVSQGTSALKAWMNTGRGLTDVPGSPTLRLSATKIA